MDLKVKVAFILMTTLGYTSVALALSPFMESISNTDGAAPEISKRMEGGLQNPSSGKVVLMRKKIIPNKIKMNLLRERAVVKKKVKKRRKQ